MKRYGLWLGMIVTAVLLSGVLFAGENQDPRIKEANSIIKKRNFLTPAGITNLLKASTGLSDEDRIMLYQKNEMESLFPLLLNAFLPSVGSWVQGDVAGALTIDICFVGGISVAVIGALTDPNKTVVSTGSSVTVYSNSPVMLAGIIVVIGAVVLDFVFPFTYANYYNEQMRTGLDLIVDRNAGSTVNFACLPRKDNYGETVFNLDLLKIPF